MVGGRLIALTRRCGRCSSIFTSAHSWVVLLPRDDTGQATIWLGVPLRYMRHSGSSMCILRYRNARNLARPPYGRSNRRNHGRDPHLCHAGDAIRPSLAVRTQQTGPGTWSYRLPFNSHAGLALIRGPKSRTASGRFSWLRFLGTRLDVLSAIGAGACGSKSSGCGSLSGCCCWWPSGIARASVMD